MIHFELIFAHGDKQKSSFILLYVALNYPTPFIEKVFFSPPYVLGSQEDIEMANI